MCTTSGMFFLNSLPVYVKNSLLHGCPTHRPRRFDLYVFVVEERFGYLNKFWVVDSHQTPQKHRCKALTICTALLLNRHFCI